MYTLATDEYKPSVSSILTQLSIAWLAVVVLRFKLAAVMSLSGDLSDKVVLIAGATGTNGLHIATEFAKHKCKLALIGHSKESVEHTAQLCKATGLPPIDIMEIAAELSHPEECQSIIDEVLKRFGRLDIIAINSGVFTLASHEIKELSLEDYEKVMKSNVTTICLSMKAAVPHLAKTEGLILNVATPTPGPNLPGGLVTQLSRAAIDRITQAIALELSGNGVHVKSVSSTAVHFGLEQWTTYFEDENPAPLIRLGVNSFPLSMQEYFSPLSEDAVVLKFLSVVPRLYSHVAKLLDYKSSSNKYELH